MDILAADSLPTVMIVDDDPINIKMMAGFLRDYYRIIVAKNGEQAWQRLESGIAPDLILMDIVMPGMDGYGVCRMIKEHPLMQDVPIIFVTSKSEVDDETRGFDAGGVDYITKPFNPHIVLARVRTHVELKRRGDLLNKLSTLDGLTQIANRRRFDQFMTFEWSRSLRSQQPISLIMMDVDHFKAYNDTYGHAAGDGCLKTVARAIEGAMKRSIDFVARYGGEEFVCVLPDTAEEGGVAVAERILQGIIDLKIPHSLSTVSPYVTMSLGVASMVPQRTTQPAELIERADQSLYKAKKGGRNRLIVHPTEISGEVAVSVEMSLA